MIKYKYIIQVILLFVFILLPRWVDATISMPISSIDVVEKKVRALRKSGIKAEEIAIVFDFHGVITNQKEQESFMTLKGNIDRLLHYLKKEKISFVVATAWNKFNDVAQSAIMKRGLAQILEVNTGIVKNKLIYFTLGKERSLKLKGYVNGKLVSLKYDQFSSDPYFRQKAFSLEAVYGQQKFKHIFFIDDSLTNINIFRDDFKNSIHEGNSTLNLLHLRELPPFFQFFQSVNSGNRTPTHVLTFSDDEEENFAAKILL